MDLTNQIIAVAGILLLVSVFASVISSRVGMPLLLVFLLLGMLLGEGGPGGIHFHDVQVAHMVGSLALAIILFDGGLRTDAKTFRVGLRPALGLATIGVVITAAITGVFAAWLLDLGWLEGLLVGAIVGSTDAAAVFALLHSHGLELKRRVGATLEIESGSNDPVAIFLTVLVVEALATGTTPTVLSLGWTFVLQMGLGAAAGIVGGRVLARLINNTHLGAGLYPLAALAGGLAVFGLTSLAGGSGFLAVYLAGLLLGNRPLQASYNIHRFHDGMAWLSQIVLFLMLGLLVTPSALLEEAPAALAVAVLLMLVARPAAVLLCLAPFRFPWREQAYISWVGLRGAVPIVLAIIPLLAGLPEATTFFNVAFVVVLVSLVVQGWTVAPTARWLGLEVPYRSAAFQRVELDVPGQLDLELVGYELGADSPGAFHPAGELPLPERCRLAAVIRQREALTPAEAGVLGAGDYVYLLAPRDRLEALDRLFGQAGGSLEQAERQFFGEFVLDGEARVADVAAVYALDLPAADGQTLSDFLAVRFNRRQVVGDRVRIGGVEFVVREVEGERVTKVGLKLPRR
ncbi:MAG: potassium/proton antiporter [Thiohalomonadaceae bacterium]